MNTLRFAFNFPLNPEDTANQTYGCRMKDPKRCGYYQDGAVCAFCRTDKICLQPSERWAKQFKKLKAETQKNNSITIHNLPRRNPSFLGREKIMDEIEQGFKSGKYLQILSGCFGIGKTQIALEYAFRHLNDYRYICWLDTSSEAAVKTAAEGFKTALSEENAAESGIVSPAAFRAFFERNSDWLLIFDNAGYNTPEGKKLLDDYLPHAFYNGDTLITSVCSKPYLNAPQIVIPGFSKADSVRYFNSINPNVKLQNVQQLLDTYCSHPLSLYAMAEYIRRTESDRIDWEALLTSSNHLDDYGKAIFDTLDMITEQNKTIESFLTLWSITGIKNVQAVKTLLQYLLGDPLENLKTYQLVYETEHRQIIPNIAFFRYYPQSWDYMKAFFPADEKKVIDLIQKSFTSFASFIHDRMPSVFIRSGVKCVTIYALTILPHFQNNSKDVRRFFRDIERFITARPSHLLLELDVILFPMLNVMIYDLDQNGRFNFQCHKDLYALLKLWKYSWEKRCEKTAESLPESIQTFADALLDFDEKAKTYLEKHGSYNSEDDADLDALFSACKTSEDVEKLYKEYLNMDVDVTAFKEKTEDTGDVAFTLRFNASDWFRD